MISTQMINHEQNSTNRATSGIGKATAEILAKTIIKLSFAVDVKTEWLNLKRTFKSTYLTFDVRDKKAVSESILLYLKHFLQ
jgi:NADP-dependent 3-hydroxy acid dehydrogenase YdfG